MDNKEINEIESLELITRMIKNARQQVRATIDRRLLLICGYMTVAVGLSIWVINRVTSFYYTSFLWLLIPLVCYPVGRRLTQREADYTPSYIYRLLHALSVLIICLCITVGLCTLWVAFPVFFVEGLLVSLWVVAVGLLMNYRFILYGGIVGLALAHGLLFLPPDTYQLPGFLLIVVCSILIPGHLLKKKLD